VFTLEQRNRGADSTNGFAPSGWRNLRTHGQRRSLLVEGTVEHIEHVEYVMRGACADVLLGAPPQPDSNGVLSPDDRRVAVVRLLSRALDRQVLELDGVRHDVAITLTAEGLVTSSSAGALGWEESPRFDEHHLAAAGGGPVCPLPGTVIAVHVEAGQSVVEGQLLMVVEAMKMEHQITAAADATVTEVRFAVGDRVDQGDLLVALDSESG
ncbi:MAG TPA: biotin/lipoyl-containing protein, partial [Ilumatobacter sp.]|nr:biotin/lipoyl-containing protein [Ilumatobacter sp.]